MLNSKPEVITSAKSLIQLWEHECSRVLPDRFTNSEDIDWFNRTLGTLANKELGEELGQAASQRSYFVDFMRDPPEPEDPEVEINPEDYKIYERVASFEVLRARLQEFMRQYNESIRGSKMD